MQSIELHRTAVAVLNVISFYQQTPLHIAARGRKHTVEKGRKHPVESLIDKGADFNIKDDSGVSIGCI